MHEKMTDEALSEALNHVAAALGHGVADELRAHIAALTAERDGLKAEMADECKAHMRTQEEVRTLRERVKALEDYSASQRAIAFKWQTSAKGLHDELAAIRQRTQSRHGLGGVLARYTGRRGPELLAALERYIVGDDAPTPSEMDGLEGEMAEMTDADAERICAAAGIDVEASLARTMATVDATAPTTAGAFAAVRKSLVAAWGGDTMEDDPAFTALSELERQMGAQEAVLRRVLAAWKTHEVTGSPSLFHDVESALTDAPPVFTLEEVRREVEASVAMWCGEAKVQTVRDDVARRLTALRR